MDVNTGTIYQVNGESELKKIETTLGTKLVPLTKKQAEELIPLSKRRRKFLMKKGSCVCGSGKSFKKCCLKKYLK